jgi:hypothetical protein
MSLKGRATPQHLGYAKKIGTDFLASEHFVSPLRCL